MLSGYWPGMIIIIPCVCMCLFDFTVVSSHLLTLILPHSGGYNLWKRQKFLREKFLEFNSEITIWQTHVS